jgi:hypothetical protein
MVRPQHFLRPEQEAGRGLSEGLFSRRVPFQCTAAHAIMARACLPYAAPGDVGAVHHDMFLDVQRPLVDRIVVFLWSVD